MSMNEHVEDKFAHGAPILGVDGTELSVGNVRSRGTIVKVCILTNGTVQCSKVLPEGLGQNFRKKDKKNTNCN